MANEDQLIKSLKQKKKEWVEFCNVAAKENMPRLKAYYRKRVRAAQLIIDTLSEGK